MVDAELLGSARQAAVFGEREEESKVVPVHARLRKNAHSLRRNAHSAQDGGASRVLLERLVVPGEAKCIGAVCVVWWRCSWLQPVYGPSRPRSRQRRPPPA